MSLGGRLEITSQVTPESGLRTIVFGSQIYQHLHLERALRRAPDGIRLDIYNQVAEVNRGDLLQVFVDGNLVAEGQVVRTETDATDPDLKLSITAGDGASIWHVQTVSFTRSAGDTVVDALKTVCRQSGITLGYVDPDIGKRTASWTTNIVGSFRQVVSDLISFEPDARWTVINGVLEVNGPDNTKATVPAFELTGETPFAKMPVISGGRLKFQTVFNPGLVPAVAVVDVVGMVGPKGGKFRVVKVIHELDQFGRVATSEVEAKKVGE